MRVLIVEDEEPAGRKLTRTLAAAAPEAQVVATTASVRETLVWLAANPAPDLILLDIELADGQSFALLEQTVVRSPVIFTTSYEAHTLRAFKGYTLDYLLKPVRVEELRAAVEKLRWLRQLQWAPGTPPPVVAAPPAGAVRQRFLVQAGGSLTPVEVARIAYFDSDSHLTFLRTLDGKRLPLDYSLDELEAMLDPTTFFRVSRSFLVAVYGIEHIEPYFGNRLAVRLRPPTDRAVLVSRDKVASFKQWLGK